MPPLIAAAVVAAAGITGTAATVVGAVVSIVAGLGLQLLLKALAPDQKQKVQSQQYSSRQSNAPRRRSYGEVQLSGPRVAYDAIGGSYYTALYLGEGPYHRVTAVFMDAQQITYTPGAQAAFVGDAPWQGFVEYDMRLGYPNQIASHLLLQLPYWSANHRGDGMAYFVVRAFAPPEKKFKKFFPAGHPPEPRVRLEGARVRDVRDPAQTTDPDTWQYSDLSGPVIYDFLTHPLWGMRVPHELMSVARFSSFNSLCRDDVPIRGGGVEQRYRVTYTYEMTQDPADVLDILLQTCDGSLTLEIDGTIGITGGRMPDVTVTITDEDVISISSLEVGTGKLSAFNRLKTSYTARKNDYQLIEGASWDDLDDQDESGETLEADFSRPAVGWHHQLQRLAKIYMKKENPRLKATGVVCKLSAADALFEEAVRWRSDEYGFDEVFLVRRPVAQIETGTIMLDLTSLAADTYSFDPATEEGPEPPTSSTNTETEVGERGDIEEPVVDSQSLERRNVSGDINAMFYHVHVQSSDRTDVSVAGQYHAVGQTGWKEMFVEGDDARSLVSDVLEDRTTYEYQLRFETYGKAAYSAWTATQTFDTAADLSVPLASTDAGAVSNGDGTWTVSWTSSSSSNVAFNRVYLTDGTTPFAPGATPIFSLDSTPSQPKSVTTGLSPGLHRFWITDVNGSGISNDGVAGRPGPAGPLTVSA